MQKKNKLIITCLKLLVVLCMLDAILTVAWITMDIAIEANPLMKVLIQESNIAFVVIKLLVSYTGIWILYQNQKKTHE